MPLSCICQHNIPWGCTRASSCSSWRMLGGAAEGYSRLWWWSDLSELEQSLHSQTGCSLCGLSSLIAQQRSASHTGRTLVQLYLQSHWVLLQRPPVRHLFIFRREKERSASLSRPVRGSTFSVLTLLHPHFFQGNIHCYLCRAVKWNPICRLLLLPNEDIRRWKKNLPFTL